MEVRLSKFAVAAMALALCGYAAAETPQLVSANAQLTQNLNTNSATEGQVVTAKLTANVKNAGQIELPKGTTLVGKVTQVEKASGSAPTKLTLTFDQAKLPNGQTVPVKATILGAYPANYGSYSTETGDTGATMAVQPRVIRSDEQVDQTAGALGNVEMHSAVQSDASAVFTSKNHDVDLRRGTRFQLAIGEAGAQAASGQ